MVLRYYKILSKLTRLDNFLQVLTSIIFSGFIVLVICKFILDLFQYFDKEGRVRIKISANDIFVFKYSFFLF